MAEDLVVLTGQYRKSVLSALNHTSAAVAPEAKEEMEQRHHRYRHGPEVMKAFIALRDASDRFSGKRLRVLFALLLESSSHEYVQARSL